MLFADFLLYSADLLGFLMIRLLTAPHDKYVDLWCESNEHPPAQTLMATGEIRSVRNPV
jgi:hypothetical protein